MKKYSRMTRPKYNIRLLCIMIALVALSRLLPHPANVTAVGAMALFGGAYFHNKIAAFVVPLLAMLLSDIVLQVLYVTGLSPEQGFHATIPFVYLSFALSVIIGFWIGLKTTFVRIAAGGAFASVLFFVITNFAVWLEGYYGYTLNGLLSCYIAAIPFYRNSLLGDAVYIMLLFGSYEIIKLKYPALAYARN